MTIHSTPSAVAAGAALVALLGAAVPAWAGDGDAPRARANRLAVTLTFGFGSASLGSYHEVADAVASSVEGPDNVTLDGSLTSKLQINGELSFRYYFPYYLLAQVGFGALYNWASATARVGPLAQAVESHNMVMEVPILVGGYYTLIDRLYLYGVVGPSVFFFGRAWWDPGSDFEADGGVGVHVGAGADFLVAEHLALGLALRYRYLKASEIKLEGTNRVITSNDLLNDGGSDTYDLDFSGVSLLLNIRFLAI